MVCRRVHPDANTPMGFIQLVNSKMELSQIQVIRTFLGTLVYVYRSIVFLAVFVLHIMSKSVDTC